MTVLSEIPRTISPSHALEQWQSGLYPISDTVMTRIKDLVGSRQSLSLFGGQRAIVTSWCIEPKMFQHLPLQWRPGTVFVDPDRWDLVRLAIRKIDAQNILVPSTYTFLRYRHWQEIMQDIGDLDQLAQQLIVTAPLDRFDYNRLRFTTHDIAQLMGGEIVEDTLIICR